MLQMELSTASDHAIWQGSQQLWSWDKCIQMWCSRLSCMTN